MYLDLFIFKIRYIYYNKSYLCVYMIKLNWKSLFENYNINTFVFGIYICMW